MGLVLAHVPYPAPGNVRYDNVKGSLKSKQIKANETALDNRGKLLHCVRHSYSLE